MIGERLKQLRIEKNILQEDLANILGFSRQALSNYENNVREPDYLTIIKIANFFGVSLDYLFGISDYKNIDEIIILKNLRQTYKGNCNPDIIKLIDTVYNFIEQYKDNEKFDNIRILLEDAIKLL